MNAYDLLTFPVQEGSRLAPPAPPPPAWPVYTAGGLPGGQDSHLVQNLAEPLSLAVPGDPLAELAWQSYFMLTAPSDDASLQAMRAQYLFSLSMFGPASEWAQAPSALSTCSPFRENNPPQTECVLANDRYYAVFEPEGARLVYLFYLDKAGVHQLVGPTAQFAVGLSDPSEWKPALGEGADPGAIPGAFSDVDATWTSYRAAAASGSLTFTSPDGSRVKAYVLTEDGLTATIHAAGPGSTRLPLAVDPQAFFFAPTDYRGTAAPGSWTWGLAGGGLRVRVPSDAALSVASFTDSQPYLAEAEDPDRDYPPGHYLPFPLSVVTLSADGDFSVTIAVVAK